MVQLPRPVAFCCRMLKENGFQAHPVGGCVRDLLLGRTPSDWDVTTSALPEDVLSLFDHTIPTGLRHGTVTVMLEDMSIEVTTFRRESEYSDGRHPDAVSFDATLTDDLSRRDFTINAMALDENGVILDPFGGQKDLTLRVIRCVGAPEQRFREDALRMLRAFRFAAQLDFSMSSDLTQVIACHSDWVSHVSAERIRTELEKAICAPCPARANGLFAFGLLDRFLLKRAAPDLNELAQAEPSVPARLSALCGLLTDCAAIESPKKFLQSLRVERRVIRETLSCCVAFDRLTLALSGGDLYAMGLRGTEIGAAQRMLVDHVNQHPEDNARDILVQILQEHLSNS